MPAVLGTPAQLVATSTISTERMFVRTAMVWHVFLDIQEALPYSVVYQDGFIDISVAYRTPCSGGAYQDRAQETREFRIQ